MASPARAVAVRARRRVGHRRWADSGGREDGGDSEGASSAEQGTFQHCDLLGLLVLELLTGVCRLAWGTGSRLWAITRAEPCRTCRSSPRKRLPCQLRFGRTCGGPSPDACRSRRSSRAAGLRPLSSASLCGAGMYSLQETICVGIGVVCGSISAGISASSSSSVRKPMAASLIVRLRSASATSPTIVGVLRSRQRGEATVHDLRIKPLFVPGRADSIAAECDALVQPEWPVVPEFDLQRRHAEA